MASFTPAPGVWTGDCDEFGNVVRRNQDARQVHHMNNMQGRLPPPPSALSPRGKFVPETRHPYFPGQQPPPPPASSPRGTFAPDAHRPHFPPGPDFTSFARPPAGFPPLIHKHHEAGAQVARNEMAAFHDSPSDLWTPGYDQFGNFCWQNKVTLKLHYFVTPPRQPPAHPHLQIGRPFEHAPRAPAERFPQWELGKDVRPPAPNVLEPSKGRIVPAVKDARPPPPVPPNNFPRSPLPSWPRAPAMPKKCKNEADQWFLQRDGKDKQYYLNTSTWKWQFETPDCLKKYTTRR